MPKRVVQGAVGKFIAELTANEVRALLALVLYRDGALDAGGKVRPLAERVKG